MSRGLIGRRYGYGAGHVPLLPAQHQARIETPTLAEGWREARRDGESPGRALLRASLRGGPTFAVVTFLLAWLFAVILAPPPDASEITIVAFTTPVEVPVPLPPKPLEPPPPPEPEPVPIERAAPEPPPEVEAPTPKPPPKLAPQPPAKRPPRPQIQRLAQPQRPPPTAPQRVERRKATPKPELAPRLTFAAVSPPEELSPPPEHRRSQRPFAAARPPDTRPRLDAPALRPAPAAQAPAPERTARRSRPTPQRAPHTQLALAAAAPALPSEPLPRRRDSRRAPAHPPPRRNGRVQASLALPDASPRRQPKPPPKPSREAVARPAPAVVARAESGDPSLPGVPLASLGACVSDRREDSLKQKLVAAVQDRTHCQSPAGRYHFVETKNLNAFLMRIERSAQRKPGDRCAELTFALDCLSRRVPSEGG